MVTRRYAEAFTWVGAAVCTSFPDFTNTFVHRQCFQAEHWHPWMVDGQVGGYATIYETPHNFTWATVRGAGHMAPLYQPLRVFNLFDKFLDGSAP